MKMIDVSKYPVIHTNLDGYQSKLVIFYNRKLNILKFSKEKNGIRDKTHISEYIASKLAKKIGIPCQTVNLAIYNGIECCMCEHIATNNTELHSYKDLNESKLYQSTGIKSNDYTIKEAISVLESYKEYHKIDEETLDRFLLMVAFDAIIGNADRHWGNWGYLSKNEEYVGLAPLYDNGNSMCTILTDKKVKKALKLEEAEFIENYVINLPNSQIKISTTKLTFTEVIKHINLTKQFTIIYNNLNIKDIEEIMEDSTLKLFCDDNWRLFIKRFLICRYRYFIGGIRC